MSTEPITDTTDCGCDSTCCPDGEPEGGCCEDVCCAADVSIEETSAELARC